MTTPARSPRAHRVLHGFTVDMSVRFIRGQATWLTPFGVEFEVVSTDGPGLTSIREQEGVRVHAVPMLRRISPLADLVALVRLIRLIRARRPDITHAHTPKAGLLLSLAAWVCRVPVRIYHVHGVPWHHMTGIRSRLLRLAEHTSCLTATRVLCVSHSVQRALAEERMCPQAKSAVPAGGSSNGIDAQRRFVPLNPRDEADLADARRVRARHGIPADAPMVGFIGRVTRDKGLIELTAAWSEVRQAMPDAHLLIVGPEEATDPLPESVRHALVSDPSVHLHGADWETPPIYHAIDLLVLPTYREGFPNVLLEAGATARAAVATRVDGCVDAIVDGETGCLVPVHDAHALAAAILRYLSDPSLRRKHGAAARARVVRGFSQVAVWQALRDEYASLMGEPEALSYRPAGADTRNQPGVADRAA